MAQVVDISWVIYQHLSPLLKDQSTNVGVSRLLSNAELSVQELQDLERSNSFSELPHNLQKHAWSLLWARIIYACLHSESFKAEYVKFVSEYSDQLKRNVAEYSILNDASVYSMMIVSGVLETESIEDLNYFYKAIYDMKESLEGPEALLKTIENRYTIVLSTGQNDISIPGLKKQLRGLAHMAQCPIQFDYTTYKEISAGISCSFIESEEVKEDEKQEMIGYLRELGVQDESISQNIQSLVTKYGYIQPNFEGQQSVVVRPGIDATTANNSAGIEISSRNQIVLEERPFYTNDRSNPKIYVFRGYFEVGDRRFNIASKEYVSPDESRLNLYREKEALALKTLSGKMDCFLEYYGMYQYTDRQNNHCLGIVMEYCEKSLMDEISLKKNNNERLSEEEILKFVRGLLDGFHFMESHKFFHLDVKPHNILLTHDRQAKIADFNVAEKMDSDAASTIPTGVHPIQGTNGYMPPEIQDHYDKSIFERQGTPLKYKRSKVDIYSLGLTFLQMYILRDITGMNKTGCQDLLKRAIGEVDIAWLRVMIKKMLVYDYNSRLTFKRLMMELPGGSTTAQFTVSDN